MYTEKWMQKKGVFTSIRVIEIVGGKFIHLHTCTLSSTNFSFKICWFTGAKNWWSCERYTINRTLCRACSPRSSWLSWYHGQVTRTADNTSISVKRFKQNTFFSDYKHEYKLKRENFKHLWIVYKFYQDKVIIGQ